MRIQCIEIRENNDLSILMLSVYLPAKRRKNHLVEYQETIDQMYELDQKYEGTHKIIIGGDNNEDLNEKPSTKRNKYVHDFYKGLCSNF